MATLPIIYSASVGVPYASGGGGGSNLSAYPVISTLTTNSSDIVHPDIIPTSGAFVVNNSTLSTVIFGQGGCPVNFVSFYGSFGGDDNQPSFMIDSSQGGLYLNISSSQQAFSTILPGTQASLQLKGDTQGYQPTQYGGDLEMGTLPDGRSYIGAALQYQQSVLSTLMLLGDGVNVSSLNVSSINGAQPGGAIPEDLSVNSLTAATSVVASTMKIAGFGVPIIQNGRVVLDESGGGTVNLDYQYTDKSFAALATYDGNVAGALYSTLQTSVKDAATVSIQGHPSVSVCWVTLGN